MTFPEVCQACLGTGVETDENGVQHDEPCAACNGSGSIEDIE